MISSAAEACRIAVAQMRRPARYGGRSRETIRRMDRSICRLAAAILETSDITQPVGWAPPTLRAKRCAVPTLLDSRRQNWIGVRSYQFGKNRQSTRCSSAIENGRKHENVTPARHAHLR